MTLGAIVSLLEAADQHHVSPIGLGRPGSYRGYYEDCAFAPAVNITIADQLVNARSALGATFSGYKGGEFEMDENSACWLAHYGMSTGADKIGDVLMAYITGRTEEVQ